MVEVVRGLSSVLCKQRNAGWQRTVAPKERHGWLAARALRVSPSFCLKTKNLILIALESQQPSRNYTPSLTWHIRTNHDPPFHPRRLPRQKTHRFLIKTHPCLFRFTFLILAMARSTPADKASYHTCRHRFQNQTSHTPKYRCYISPRQPNPKSFSSPLPPPPHSLLPPTPTTAKPTSRPAQPNPHPQHHVLPPPPGLPRPGPLLHPSRGPAQFPRDGRPAGGFCRPSTDCVSQFGRCALSGAGGEGDCAAGE